MVSTIPPEIAVHQNRISPELRDFIAQTLGMKITPKPVTQLIKTLWNIIDDPVYETDEELKYLASKLGVITGNYDLSIKCISDSNVGTKVWGSVGLFEIGQVDQAFRGLFEVLEDENTDVVPLIEALFWIIYLKTLIGDTEELENFKELLQLLFEEKKTMLIPVQLRELKNFADGLVDLYSSNSVSGIKKIEEFYQNRKEAKDQYWLLLSLLVMGEQKLDTSDFKVAEEIYKESSILASNLANITLTEAAQIGTANVFYLKGLLKHGNVITAKIIDKLQGQSHYYSGKAHFIRGKLLAKLGQHSSARNHFFESNRLAERYGDHNKEFLSLLAIADNYSNLDEMDKAEELYEKAYTQVVNISNKKQFTKALTQLVIGDYKQEKYERAFRRIDQIETLSEEILYQKGKTDALRLRAQIAILRNQDLDKQINVLKACQVLYTEIRDEENDAGCSILIADAYRKSGRNEEAAKHLEEAKNFYLTVHDNMKIAQIKELQSTFDVKEGRYDEALVKLRAAYSHYSDIFDRTMRARCLRRIADILVLKASFVDGIDRYEKVRNSLIDFKKGTESAIINLNEARVIHITEKSNKSLKYFEDAEKYAKDNKLTQMVFKIYTEKAYSLALRGNKNKLKEIKEEIDQLEGIEDKTKKTWNNFLTSTNLIQEEEYQEAYELLLQILHDSLEKDSLMPLGILFSILRILMTINRLDIDDFTVEEVNNYLGLTKSLVAETNFFYLQGLVSLIEIVLQYITSKNQNIAETIVQASTFFASTGMEKFSTKLLILQYNISVWEDNVDKRIKQILGSPKPYDSPFEALYELVDQARFSLFIERIRTTENDFVQELSFVSKKQKTNLS